MRLSGLSRFFAKSFLGAGIFNQASWAKAIFNMEKAVELDPGRIYHHLELAEIYAERKRVADAKRSSGWWSRCRIAKSWTRPIRWKAPRCSAG